MASTELVMNVTSYVTEREQTLFQEDVILTVFEAVVREMKRRKISKTRVARRLGITEAKVNRMLEGRNITLRTLGNLLWAINGRMEVRIGVARH